MARSLGGGLTISDLGRGYLTNNRSFVFCSKLLRWLFIVVDEVPHFKKILRQTAPHTNKSFRLLQY